MSIQQYIGGEDAIVAYQREEITPEERERRQKEVSGGDRSLAPRTRG